MVGKKWEEYLIPHNMYIKYNIVSPSDLYVEVLTPVSSKCGFNLYGNWVGPWSNLTGVLIKKGKSGQVYVYRENIR